MLFSDEEEKEAQFGVKPVDKKVESVKEPTEFGRTHMVDKSEQVDCFFLVSSDMFVSHMFL